ncbi:hypothetical protein MSR1_31530 [Magnetospirillum gryphiswaldense MSR-1]|uniref:Membrane protein n=2 Tax=Magnetospirillum gryphiswaldense TaxID=55518 RepID=A4U2U8_9PROT|nr:hypothetical protein MSR1_31530 [Magnetospirillum gryphiswaldense MSR-1]AVM79522.1 hypothetical protein MSR1L_31530 [Magnetospirillum gryphiswaldense]CAM77205.1 membrane protein [Magnetospirillum gryphiswaldense MSR-1]
MSGGRLDRPMLGLVVVLAAASVLPLDTVVWGWWAFRGLVAVAVLAGVLRGGRCGDVPAILVPPLTMAVLVMLLYVLAPAAAVDLLLGGPVAMTAGEPASWVRRLGALEDFETAVRAVASPAELWVLRFVLGCLLLAQLMRPFLPQATVSWAPWRLAVMLGLAIGGLNLARRFGLPLPEAAAPLLPPLMILCLAMAFLALLRRRPWAWPAYGALILAALTFLPFGGIKFLFLTLVVQMLALLIDSRLPVWLRLGASVAAIAVVLGGAYLATRGHSRIVTSGTDLQRVLVGKLAYRQAETMFCLNHVLRGESGDQPLYFLAAPVPRLLWPDKPSLSNGGDHAVRYCGRFPDDVAVGNHSASITLLGEPYSRGGGMGLTLSMIVVGGVLSVSGLLLARSGAGAVVVLATLPWIVDFDQDFAMWLANITKFGLAATVTTILIYAACRRRKTIQE